MKWPELLCLITALSLMVFTAPTARSQGSWDGDFWKTKGRDLKLVYVTGFVDGRNEGANEVAGALGTSILDPKIAKLASKVTVGQIVDGLDEFYQDYRNARILVRYAIEYVVMEAQGEDGSSLSKSSAEESRATAVEVGNHDGILGPQSLAWIG
jgi:hypothetical protein